MAKRDPRPRASESAPNATEEINPNPNQTNPVRQEAPSKEIKGPGTQSAIEGELVEQVVAKLNASTKARKSPADRAAPLDRTLPRQMVPFQWKPGQSGNPGGRPRIESEVRRLAQDNSPIAMTRLIQIAAKSRDERAAIIASQTILDRAFGPAKDPPPEDTTRERPDLSALSDKKIKQLRALLREIVGLPKAAG